MKSYVSTVGYLRQNHWDHYVRTTEGRTVEHEHWFISGVHRDIDATSAVLAYYASLNGSSVLTSEVNLSVPSSRVKKS
jgi:hypothetical protein